MGRYSNQLPINQTGYDTAIEYYSKLKEQFLNNYLERANEQKIASELMTFEQAEQAFITKTNNQSSSGETAAQILNRVFQNFSKVPSVSQLSSRVQQEIRNTNPTIAENWNSEGDAEFRKQRFATIGAAVKKLQTQQESQMGEILKQALKSSLRTSGVRLEGQEEIIAKAITLFKILVNTQMYGKVPQELTGLTGVTMQGYIREQLELLGLRKIVTKGIGTVRPGGAKKVKMAGSNKKVETEFDNIITFAENLRGWSGQVRAQANINLSLKEMFSRLPSIQYYAEQVKSFDLLNAASHKFDQHRIGSKKDLFNIFKKEMKSDNDYYMTQIKSAHFLAQVNYIIHSFGLSTVFMSTNTGRQWTSQFITDFKNAGYRLAFMYNSKDNKMDSTVILRQETSLKG